MSLSLEERKALPATRLPAFIGEEIRLDTDPQIGAQSIVRRLQEDDGLLLDAFWQFFHVEGMGSHWHLIRYAPEAWDHAILTLCKTVPGFRERMLNESLGAMLQDFSAANSIWYVRIHRLLDPQPQEIAARQPRYFAVLATTPSTVVGLAQDMLGRIIQGDSADALDADALVQSSHDVLGRTEKKLLKAQLKLLAALHGAGKQRAQISQVTADHLAGMPLDIAALAKKLVGDVKESTAPLQSQASAQTRPADVAAVRASALPDTPLDRAPLGTDDELFALVAEHLEGVGHGADYPRIVDYLLANPEVSFPDYLHKRGAEISAKVGDHYRDTSPRCLLAAALFGGKTIDFKGYVESVLIGPDEPVPADVVLADRADDGSVGSVTRLRSGRRLVATHSPMALLIGMFQRLQLLRSQGRAFEPPAVVAARRFDWTKHRATSGQYRNPYWTVTGAPDRVRADAPLDELALDVSAVQAEWIFRNSEAHVSYDGYDQAVQWAAWLLRENLDSLAAHSHPMAAAGVFFQPARGIGPLVEALGASKQPPGAPMYSALALAASAKVAELRTQTAEAIARLADSGLLDSLSFAEQIAEHLADDCVMAGRVAQTLEDAANISAIAGYRVLQMLEALLLHVMDEQGKPRTQAGKLVELAARLSLDYGTPLVVPSSLASRSKGASALAVAIRTLQAVQPHVTTLLQQARTQGLTTV